MRFETLGQLADTLKGVVRITDGEVTILTLPPIRGGLLDLLADAALQGARSELRAMARWLIEKLAPQMEVMLRTGVPDHADRFKRTAVSCSPELLYTFLRDRFRNFLDEEGSGLDVTGGNSVLAEARAGLDAVAVAAAIQAGFIGALYRPETSETSWRLFAVRRGFTEGMPSLGKS